MTIGLFKYRKFCRFWLKPNLEFTKKNGLKPVPIEFRKSYKRKNY